MGAGSQTTLKQKMIISVCFIQILFFCVSQAPYVDLTNVEYETVAHQMSFSFSALKKIKDWRGNQKSLFIRVVNKYFSITQLGYPSYYFFLGAPKVSVFYSIEFTDKSGSPAAEKPFFTTCPLAWNECLAGANFFDNLRMPIFEMILIGQESVQNPFPPYFLIEYAKKNLKSSNPEKFVAFVAYEQPVNPWFVPSQEPVKRRVIYVTN